jgi:hypothetical protein
MTQNQLLSKNTSSNTKNLKQNKAEEDLPGLVKLDPWLSPYTNVINAR